MRLSNSATALTIGLLLACTNSSAENRSASSSQRYVIHVPKEVKFGTIETPELNAPLAQHQMEDADSVVFMAETTAGVTILFETDDTATQKLPLKLTVGGGEDDNWWANEADDQTGSQSESVAEAASVQASTLKAGWTTLELGVSEPSAADAAMTTIVVTIVAH